MTINIMKPKLLNDAVAVSTELAVDARLWNWHNSLSANKTTDTAAPANYYEASLEKWNRFPRPDGDSVCDVVVVGGGLLGASSALHLAEQGLDVVLLEKDSIGSAASGRNGGQLTPGLARWEAADMIANLSETEAQRLWDFSASESMNLIDDILQRYGFDADRKYGHITAAVHPGHMSALIEGVDARRKLGDSKIKTVGAYELEQYIASENYYGAAVDNLGGQIHTLALLRGLVYAAVSNGARVYENTQVNEIKETAEGTWAVTDYGVIKAKKALILAVHNTTFRFLPGESTTTVPFYTYVGVTPPLETPVAELLPADMAVYDTQFQIDYYRAVRNNRLLFGGQGTGRSWAPEKINSYLIGRIRTVFPQLDNPELEYSWSGISDFTVNGATDCRKTDGQIPLYMVHGWSGHGVAQTVRIGKALCDDITGKNDDFSMLTTIDHMEIPLGRQLSPFAIPLVKAAVGIAGTVNPGKLISF